MAKILFMFHLGFLFVLFSIFQPCPIEFLWEKYSVNTNKSSVYSDVRDIFFFAGHNSHYKISNNLWIFPKYKLERYGVYFGIRVVKFFYVFVWVWIFLSLLLYWREWCQWKLYPLRHSVLMFTKLFNRKTKFGCIKWKQKKKIWRKNETFSLHALIISYKKSS